MEIGELKHPWVKHDHFVGLQVDYLNSWQRVQDIIQIVQLLGFAFFVETRKSQSDFTDGPVVLSGVYKFDEKAVCSHDVYCEIWIVWKRISQESSVLFWRDIQIQIGII